MFRKFLSALLAGLLLNMLAASPFYADSKEEKEARFVERLKESIRELGTGKEARVEVKLHDKRKLRGYVGGISEDHFVVVDAKTGASVPVSYPQVRQVKGKNNLSGKQIIITAVVVALFVIPLVIFAKRN